MEIIKFNQFEAIFKLDLLMRHKYLIIFKYTNPVIWPSSGIHLIVEIIGKYIMGIF